MSDRYIETLNTSHTTTISQSMFDFLVMGGYFVTPQGKSSKKKSLQSRKEGE